LVYVICGRTGNARHIVSSWLDGETYFTADKAKDAGLIDEIIPEPKPSRVKRASKPAIICAIKPPTEQELLLRTMPNAFGKIESSDKAALGRELTHFFNNVRET